MLKSDLPSRLQKYLKDHNLQKKFDKQFKFLKENPSHPSLNIEIIEPKVRKIYSFRIDRKYRAVFVEVKDEILIIDINNHYQ